MLPPWFSLAPQWPPHFFHSRIDTDYNRILLCDMSQGIRTLQCLFVWGCACHKAFVLYLVLTILGISVPLWSSVVPSRAGPSRCGAQCKTWARGPMQDLCAGPPEQWFYDVIVFSQPCYDRGKAQICSTALTRESSTFANVREEIC